MSIFYTSDTHFGHEAVAKLRGFDSAEAHDEFVIAQWNSVVRPQDTVWHLGDVSLALPQRFASLTGRLNGHIHLVSGNHDYCWHRRTKRADVRRALASVGDYLDAGIEEVYTSGSIQHELKGFGSVILSHMPTDGDHTESDRYRERRPSSEGVVVCGHVHDAWQTSGHNINVGLDVRGMRPVSGAELRSLIAQMGLKPAVGKASVDGPWNAFGLA